MSTTEISQIGQHPCCIHQTGSNSSGDQELYVKRTRGILIRTIYTVS